MAEPAPALAAGEQQDSGPAVERTALCLVHPAARANEAEIVALLASEHGLAVKQRTERGLSARGAQGLAALVGATFEAEELARLEEEALETQSQSKKTPRSAKTPRSSRSTESKTDLEADGVDEEDTEDLAREERQRAAAAAAADRKDAFARTVVAACAHEDLVALALLGEQSTRALQEAFASDERLRQLAGLLADEDGTEAKEQEAQPEAETKAAEPQVPAEWAVLIPPQGDVTRRMLEFFFKPPEIGEVDFSEVDDNERRQLQEWKPPDKSATLREEDILRFMFPAEERHPSSTGRMLLLGENGPLDAQCQLRGGIKDRHVVQKLEIKSMVRYLDTRDLLSIYVGDAVLTDEEEVEVIKQADPRIRHDKQLTREQAIALFEDLPRDAEGRLCFHAVQQVIFKFREERVLRWKRMAVNSIHKAKPSKKEIARQKRHQRALGVAAREVLQPAPKIDPEDIFMVTSKLLHKHSCEICDLQDNRSPDLVFNVRALRRGPSAADKHGAIPWQRP